MAASSEISAVNGSFLGTPISKKTTPQEELNNNNEPGPMPSPNWCCATEFFANRGTKVAVGTDFSPAILRRFPISPVYFKHKTKEQEALGITYSILPKLGKQDVGVASLTMNDLPGEEVAGFLFPPQKLASIDFADARNTYPDGISPRNAGKGLKLRPLHIEDFLKGYLHLLEQLTTVGELTKRQFDETFHELKAGRSQYIVVIEDESREKIIGSATLVLERKFIHSGGVRGRIEDVVVNNQYRGRQLGKLLVESLTLLGKELGCYKMSLECKDKLISFYESFGFTVDEGNNFLVQRFKD